MLVVGLGSFGSNLARMLSDLGNEVMVVDKDEVSVEHLEPFVTTAEVADCQDPDVLVEIGVTNFDICFVCVNDFQSSLEITLALKELGAARVVATTDKESQAKFLERIGADEVIHAERDMAQRIAHRYSTSNTFDYIELSDDYAIIEILTPKDWTGRSIRDIAIRSKYKVNVLGFKSVGNQVQPALDPDRVFQAGEHIIISGIRKDVMRIIGKD